MIAYKMRGPIEFQEKATKDMQGLAIIIETIVQQV
jgi:hypothetical protein